MSRFIKPLVALAALSIAFTAPAFADAKTEAYVERNANDALKSLKDPALNQDAKRVKFIGYMDEFTDMDRVAKFVVGKYGRRFTDAEMATYQTAFREYALAVYELYLMQFSDTPLKVEKSDEVRPGDFVVETTVYRVDGSPSDVRWRVQEKDAKYQVVDIGLNFDGNLLWLGVEQKAQFVSLLDQNNGSVDVLVKKMNEMTESVKADIAKGALPKDFAVSASDE